MRRVATGLLLVVAGCADDGFVPREPDPRCTFVLGDREIDCEGDQCSCLESGTIARTVVVPDVCPSGGSIEDYEAASGRVEQACGFAEGPPPLPAERLVGRYLGEHRVSSSGGGVTTEEDPQSLTLEIVRDATGRVFLNESCLLELYVPEDQSDRDWVGFEFVPRSCSRGTLTLDVEGGHGTLDGDALELRYFGTGSAEGEPGLVADVECSFTGVRLVEE